MELAARFHEVTKHGPTRRRDPSLVEFRPLDPANRPDPFKRYSGLSPRPLPSELGSTGAAAGAVLSGRATPEPAAVDEVTLARLLFLSAGVTRTISSSDLGDPVWFRAAMSAGNLHPVEVYAVTGDVAGAGPGVFHFAPLEFGLTRLRPEDWRAHLAATVADPAVAAAPVSLVLTGIPWRTGWKYGERGWRHLYWDAGTIIANLLAVAAAHGLPTRILLGFSDAEVAHLVGADGTEELPLAVVAIGHGDPAPERPGPPEPLDLEVAALSAHPIVFPLVTEAQRSGALDGAGAVTVWRAAAREAGEPCEGGEIPAGPDGSSIDETILRRGSTRRMLPEDIPEATLGWGMAVATQPLPADFAAGGRTLLEHWVSVHGVRGVEPGVQRWQAGRRDAVRPGDFREVAEQLCLGQPLGGESAYTAFHCTDLGAVLDRLGSRGYRAAQLEAGSAAGRLSLAAVALGCGATGLTFFDDAVSAFFATPATPMLATAVGAPAYRNRPGGTPGRPAEIMGAQQPRPSRRPRPAGR